MRSLPRLTALLGVLTAVVANPTAVLGAQRSPVLGCIDLKHFSDPTRVPTYKPSGLCETGDNLIGIDHAHWTGWGRRQATSRGDFVDGLGFEYRAKITAYDLRKLPGSTRKYYYQLHVIASGGNRGGVFRGPFNIFIKDVPQVS
jgi:hypothetical protein